MRISGRGDPAAQAAFAIDHLAAEAGLHPGPEPELANTLDIADMARVVHGGPFVGGRDEPKVRPEASAVPHILAKNPSAGYGVPTKSRSNSYSVSGAE